MKKKPKTTMSVSEMRKMLGLKKTESYWLVHRGFFQTTLVNGKMRVDIASFEKWYAGQTKWKKVNGPPPGEELKSYSYSIREFAELLAVSESVGYDIVKRYHIETFMADTRMRIRKDVFEAWYKSQTKYRTPEDRERDKALEEASYTMPEIAGLLLMSRNDVYYKVIYNRAHEQAFDFIFIGGRRRITKESFHAWYQNQNQYRMLCDLTPEEQAVYEQKRQAAERELRQKELLETMPRLKIDPNKSVYGAEEAAILLDVKYRDLLDMIARGELEAKKYGHKYLIYRDEISWWLLQQKLHQENPDRAEERNT